MPDPDLANSLVIGHEINEASGAGAVRNNDDPTR